VIVRSVSEVVAPLFIGQIGVTEILIIILIAIILFGPQKIPELARSLGQAVRIFREEASRLTEPVKTTPEREEKSGESELVKIAKTLGIETEGKSEEELKAEISKKMKEKGLL